MNSWQLAAAIDRVRMKSEREAAVILDFAGDPQEGAGIEEVVHGPHSLSSASVKGLKRARGRGPFSPLHEASLSRDPPHELPGYIVRSSGITKQRDGRTHFRTLVCAVV